MTDMKNQASVEPFLIQTHSLLAYAGAHRQTIKLRDQKQTDFEELSAYLSAVVSERDRLAALSSGYAGAPVGLGTYLRDQVDKLRGTDDPHTRRERMRKLDGRIKEVSHCIPLGRGYGGQVGRAVGNGVPCNRLCTKRCRLGLWTEAYPRRFLKTVVGRSESLEPVGYGAWRRGVRPGWVPGQLQTGAGGLLDSKPHAERRFGAWSLAPVTHIPRDVSEHVNAPRHVLPIWPSPPSIRRRSFAVDATLRLDGQSPHGVSRPLCGVTIGRSDGSEVSTPMTNLTPCVGFLELGRETRSHDRELSSSLACWLVLRHWVGRCAWLGTATRLLGGYRRSTPWGGEF